MRDDLQHLEPPIETIAELRELYRAAESRAARMRFLSQTAQDLARAEASTIEEALRRSGERLAFFVGTRRAAVSLGGVGEGIAIPGPGTRGEPVGRISIEGLPGLESIPDPEDRDAVRMHLELMGATIDRIGREHERTRLLAALREREQRLGVLVGRMFSAQEDERRRVSRELHDGVAQTATALVRILEGAEGHRAEALSVTDRARLAGVARELVTELRAVIGNLRPTLLDDLGLEAALRALADGLAADGYTIRFSVEGEVALLQPHVETALFRVAQEAVSNIRKHAGGPCMVALELRIPGDNGARFLRIRDGGRGLAADRAAADGTAGGNHVGIEVMRERMTAIGGSLDWLAGIQGGVSVTAHLPENL
ncbi:MAG: histidine kinase [Erythrobacter sp. 34-65-8]|nr:MAG: histidine kinase [Erythrobacter sp. 34-65-8]